MKLPNNKKAVISRGKLTNYILSETHITGKFKAKYFNKLGFNKANVDVFEQSIRNIAEAQDVVEILETSYGNKYVIDGEIKSPSGIAVKVRTVWIIERRQKGPRFITVYPV